MTIRFSLLALLLLLPLDVHAQPRLATDTDTLFFGNRPGAVNALRLWNATSDTLRIDSLRFSTQTAHGWFLKLSRPVPDTTYRLDYAFGLLQNPLVFPNIRLTSGDTLRLSLTAFDSCLVCGGKRTGRGDTLYIYSNDPLANPKAIPVDFTFYVSVEANETPPPLAFQIYPNPAASRATVDLDLSGSPFVRVVLYDVLGRSVRQLHAGLVSGPMTVDVSGLPGGVYFVRVEGGQTVLTRKLTIIP